MRYYSFLLGSRILLYEFFSLPVFHFLQQKSNDLLDFNIEQQTPF
jgi:hypothetical protein